MSECRCREDWDGELCCKLTGHDGPHCSVNGDVWPDEFAHPKDVIAELRWALAQWILKAEELRAKTSAEGEALRRLREQLAEAHAKAGAYRAEMEGLKRKLPPAFTTDYARMWDLVRYCRAQLMDAGLITREECATLCSEETKTKPGQGSPSPRRLESYDELRERAERAEAEVKRIQADKLFCALLEAQDKQLAAEAQLAQAREALRDYGRHRRVCAHNVRFNASGDPVGGGEQCDCGLWAAISAAAPTAPETPKTPEPR